MDVSKNEPKSIPEDNKTRNTQKQTSIIRLGEHAVEQNVVEELVNGLTGLKVTQLIPRDAEDAKKDIERNLSEKTSRKVNLTQT